MNIQKQLVKVAIVPVQPIVINGKQFDLRYTKLENVFALLAEKQHFQVIVYSGDKSEEKEIPGRYNAEKAKNLAAYLRKINKKQAIAMPEGQQLIYPGKK